MLDDGCAGNASSQRRSSLVWSHLSFRPVAHGCRPEQVWLQCDGFEPELDNRYSGQLLLSLVYGMIIARAIYSLPTGGGIVLGLFLACQFTS